MKKMVRRICIFLAMSLFTFSLNCSSIIAEETAGSPQQSSTPFILCGDLEKYIENMIGQPFFTVCYAYTVEGNVITALMDRESVTTSFNFKDDYSSTVKVGDCIAVEGTVGSVKTEAESHYIDMENCTLISFGSDAEQFRLAATDSSYIPFLTISDKVAEWMGAGVQASALAGAEVGSVITFGKYEQDYNFDNGEEAIEWVVLAKEGNRILVLSKYAIDQAYYHNVFTDVTWEDSKLRYDLNNYFLVNYFTEEEQKMIPAVTVPADNNLEFSTGTAGNDTEDRIFILSTSEVERYLPTPEARICACTTLARSRGISEDAWWWLRTPGEFRSSASNVYHDGSINNKGCVVTNYVVAVRPAMWIELG